jgi:hypothetical protein
MKSFDEWKEEQERIHNDYDAENAWYAGQQSKQAEVDELQKRIDDIVKWVECNKASIPLSEWHGYTTEEYVDADDLLDILKGDQS